MAYKKRDLQREAAVSDMEKAQAKEKVKPDNVLVSSPTSLMGTTMTREQFNQQEKQKQIDYATLKTQNPALQQPQQQQPVQPGQQPQQQQQMQPTMPVKPSADFGSLFGLSTNIAPTGLVSSAIGQAKNILNPQTRQEEAGRVAAGVITGVTAGTLGTAISSLGETSMSVVKLTKLAFGFGAAGGAVGKERLALSTASSITSKSLTSMNDAISSINGGADINEQEIIYKKAKQNIESAHSSVKWITQNKANAFMAGSKDNLVEFEIAINQFPEMDRQLLMAKYNRQVGTVAPIQNG